MMSCRYDKIDFQKAVRTQFMKLKAEDEGRAEQPLMWHVVDANQSIEAVEAEVATVVAAVQEQVRGRPITKVVRCSAPLTSHISIDRHSSPAVLQSPPPHTTYTWTTSPRVATNHTLHTKP
jgi:hypothetical protein